MPKGLGCKNRPVTAIVVALNLTINTKVCGAVKTEAPDLSHLQRHSVRYNHLVREAGGLME